MIQALRANLSFCAALLGTHRPSHGIRFGYSITVRSWFIRALPPNAPVLRTRVSPFRCSHVMTALTPATSRPRTQLERATVYPVFGALVGAWFGVIPLALDWDRPWQVRPYSHPPFKTLSTDKLLRADLAPAAGTHLDYRLHRRRTCFIHAQYCVGSSRSFQSGCD